MIALALHKGECELQLNFPGCLRTDIVAVEYLGIE